MSSQNSSNFTFRQMDTQNSICSKLEKLLLAGKRVVSLFGRRRWKDSSMLWGQRDRKPRADAGKQHQHEKFKWFLFTHEPSWEICTNVCVEKVGRSRLGATGGSLTVTLFWVSCICGDFCACLSRFALIYLIDN